MHLRLVLFACGLDGVVALALLWGGVASMRFMGNGMADSGDRAEFAIGMFLGGLAIVALVLSALMMVHAYWSWRRFRRLGAAHALTLRDVIALLWLPLAAVAVGFAIGVRMLA